MRKWVGENLPQVAAFAAAVRAEFADVRLVHASEAGHVLGDENAGRKPCDGCCHLFTRLVSPDGARQQRACQLYRVAANRCADYREAK